MTLDPVLKDSNGIPAPKVDYTISENRRRMHPSDFRGRLLDGVGDDWPVDYAS